MKCPYSGEVDSQSYRLAADGGRRKDPPPAGNACTAKKRFTTYEIVETVPLMVVEKGPLP